MTYKATEELLSKIRTPSETVVLPAASDVYTKDIVEPSIDGKITIHPMITEDERLFASAAAFTEGTGIYETIQKRIPSIKQPRKLYSPDILFLVAALRAISFTSLYEIKHDCTKCGNEINTTVDSNTFQLDEYTKDDLVNSLTLSNGQLLKYRFLTFDEGIRIDKQDDMHAGYIARIIEVDGITDRHAITKWFKALPFKLRSELSEPFRKKLGGFITNIKITCPACNHQNDHEVDILAGFFTQLLSLN